MCSCGERKALMKSMVGPKDWRRLTGTCPIACLRPWEQCFGQPTEVILTRLSAEIVAPDGRVTMLTVNIRKMAANETRDELALWAGGPLGGLWPPGPAVLYGPKAHQCPDSASGLAHGHHGGLRFECGADETGSRDLTFV